MISNVFIKEIILPKIIKEGRDLDHCLIKSLIENCDEELLVELEKFQNDDGGFGNGLEVDIRLPASSVAATNLAIYYLQFVHDKKLTEQIKKDIVRYFEDVIIQKEDRWEMVPKTVEDHPHAIWWNYDSLDSFTFGNPNPEVIGFLYKNRKHLKKININNLINNIIKYIKGDWMEEHSMHSLLSIIRFYNDLDVDVKNLIRDDIHKIVDLEIESDEENWQSYGLEPYKIAVLNIEFISNHQKLFDRNLKYLLEKIKGGIIYPNHTWYRDDDVCSAVINEWTGLVTFDVVRALRINRE